MIEEASVKIELLRDEKGIYGIGLKGLPETSRCVEPIIVRPDRIRDVDVNCATDAALQAVPSKGFGTSSAEYRLIDALCESWRAESAKKMGLDQLPPKYYFALRQRSKRIVNSLIHEALAVANPEYLKTARRYPIFYRYPIYSACCLYGERANQIANIFPAAAIVAYGRLYGVHRTMAGYCDPDQTDIRAKCDEVLELIEKGVRLGIIAKALKLPKISRYVRPVAVESVVTPKRGVRPIAGTLESSSPPRLFLAHEASGVAYERFLACKVAILDSGGGTARARLVHSPAEPH